VDGRRIGGDKDVELAESVSNDAAVEGHREFAGFRADVGDIADIAVVRPVTQSHIHNCRWLNCVTLHFRHRAGTAKIDPKHAFKIGRLDRREGRESGRRRYG
jgi:hypothetical protein